MAPARARGCALFAALAVALAWAPGGLAAPAEAAASPAEVTEEVAVLETDKGTIVIAFHPDVAPRHVEHFKELVRTGFYDGTRFHRVVPGFMIQGGCPNTKTDNRLQWGRGGPGRTVDAEFNDRPHLRGSVAMARTADPNSAGSQFFICVAPAPHLDRQYTNFGTVIAGLDVVDTIVALPRMAGREMPKEPAVVRTARLAPRTQAPAPAGP